MIVLMCYPVYWFTEAIIIVVTLVCGYLNVVFLGQDKSQTKFFG